MIISLIAAASTNNVIGKANGMVWNLPNDTKYFKNTTWGMPVIMGRKTYESMKSEPLPGRFNFVITRHQDWDPQNPAVRVAGSLEEAIRLAGETDCKEAFVAGGGQIYAEAMPTAEAPASIMRATSSPSRAPLMPINGASGPRRARVSASHWQVRGRFQ